MISPSYFLTPTAPVLDQFLFAGIMTKNIRPSKKGFFPESWAGIFNVMPRTVEDDTSGKLHKKKNQIKN